MRKTETILTYRELTQPTASLELPPLVAAIAANTTRLTIEKAEKKAKRKANRDERARIKADKDRAWQAELDAGRATPEEQPCIHCGIVHYW